MGRNEFLRRAVFLNRRAVEASFCFSKDASCFGTTTPCLSHSYLSDDGLGASAAVDYSNRYSLVSGLCRNSNTARAL